MLIGNSGVGKSSLVQAGVIGSLKRQRWPGDETRAWPDALRDSRAWAYLSIKPGEQPVRALAGAFTGLWFEDPTDPARFQRTDEWTARLRDGGSLADLLEATQAHFQRMGMDPPSRVLLYVDQGEELYSRADKTEAARFSKVLSGSLANPSLTVMASMRSDYYGYLQADAALFGVAEKVDVPPLGSDELRGVLRSPAQRMKVSFDSEGFVDQMVQSAEGQPGALPLLADAMAEVWKRMQERGDRVLRLTEQPGIAQTGSSLARRADRFLERNPAQHAATRNLFTLRLVSIPAEGEPVRRRATRAECSDAEWAVVEALAGPDWRILVTGESEGAATAEVAHEIILTKWDTLKRWLAEEREFLIWKSAAERSMQDWRSTPFYFKRDALLSGSSLFQARRWMRSKNAHLTKETRRYIGKSLRRNWPILMLGALGTITVLLFIAMSLTFGPYSARYAELSKTDPNAGNTLLTDPEFFWTLVIFFATFLSIILTIVVLLLIYSKVRSTRSCATAAVARSRVNE